MWNFGVIRYSKSLNRRVVEIQLLRIWEPERKWITPAIWSISQKLEPDDPADYKALTINSRQMPYLQAFCKHKAQKPLKKQMFQFENFRVRKLTAINALNFYIPLCMAFLAHMSMKSETHALKVAIIQKADPIKEKIHFSYYRLAKGISGILSYVKEGIRLWFRTKRPIYRQLCLKLVA